MNKAVKKSRKEYLRAWVLKNKSKKYASNKLWLSKNKKKIKGYLHQYYIKNKNKAIVKNKEWRNNHPEQYKTTNRKYYLENKSRQQKLTKKNYLKNKASILGKNKLWVMKNKNKVNLYKNNWTKLKKKNNPAFKLHAIVSNELCRSINKRRRIAHNLLPYSFEELKKHLEKQFTKEMSWGNHGVYWDIDHVVPISWFKTEEQIIKKGYALTNLQPLESNLNNKKRNFYVGNPKTNMGVIYL